MTRLTRWGGFWVVGRDIASRGRAAHEFPSRSSLGYTSGHERVVDPEKDGVAPIAPNSVPIFEVFSVVVVCQEHRKLPHHGVTGSKREAPRSQHCGFGCRSCLCHGLQTQSVHVQAFAYYSHTYMSSDCSCWKAASPHLRSVTSWCDVLNSRPALALLHSVRNSRYSKNLSSLEPPSLAVAHTPTQDIGPVMHAPSW